MTEREELELKLADLDQAIEFIHNELRGLKRLRHSIWMDLNRARRLEREELQNAKTLRD